MKLSLVIPCYNEEANINVFYNYVKDNYKDVENYELIFINDGSKDNTLLKLKEISSDKKHVKVISFSRNFGKESAMLAGLKASSGDYVCIIDADMQQDPVIVLDMLKILEENDNYDVVSTYQETRKESSIISFFKKSFYKIINKLSQVDFHQGVSDFRLFRRQVVDAILLLNEDNRFSKDIFSYVGFNNYYYPYIPFERNAGKSSFSFKKLFNYAIDGIISFSTKPLLIPFYLGVMFLIATLISLIILLCHYDLLILVVTLILLIAGLQFIVMGIIGKYLSQIHIQSKERPTYIIKEKINLK